MKTEELLTAIEPRWADAFTRFVQTGEAENDFLEYVNQSQEAQQAVEAAFEAQARAFQSIAEDLKKAEPGTSQYSSDMPDVSVVAAQAVEDVMLLPPQKSREAMEKVASALKAALRPEQQRVVIDTLVEALGHGSSSKVASRD